MLLAPGLSSYGFTYNNWGTNPGNAPGSIPTAGTSNAEGTFLQIASTSNIAQDCYWLAIKVMGGGINATQVDHLLDIGVDPAGGTAYSAVISNIVCGASGTVTSQQTTPMFVFPIFIKAGSSVAARTQTQGSAANCRVVAKFWGQPSNPAAVPVGSFSETIGTITNSGGVSFTPGNAADGSWVDLGATTNDMWWWQLCYQLSNGTITAERTYIDLAWGDATNKVVIQRQMHAGLTTETVGDQMVSNLIFPNCYQPVPGGTHLYVRGRCENAPDSGYNAVAVGIGG